MILWQKKKGIFWFTLFGYGLMFRNWKLRLHYWERYGYQRILKIGPWVIQYLKPFNF